MYRRDICEKEKMKQSCDMYTPTNATTPYIYDWGISPEVKLDSEKLFQFPCVCMDLKGSKSSKVNFVTSNQFPPKPKMSSSYSSVKVIVAQPGMNYLSYDKI